MAQASAVASSGPAVFTSTCEARSEAMPLWSRLFIASMRRRSLAASVAARHEAASRIATLRALRTEYIGQFTCAVAEMIERDARLIEHAHQQIIHRRVLRKAQ